MKILNHPVYLQKQEFYEQIQFSDLPQNVEMQTDQVETINFAVQIENGREKPKIDRSRIKSWDRRKYNKLDFSNSNNKNFDSDSENDRINHKVLKLRKSKSFDFIALGLKERDKDLYIFKLQKILTDTDLEQIKEVNITLYLKLVQQLQSNEEEFEMLKSHYLK